MSRSIFRTGPLRGSVRQVVEIDGHVYAVQGNRGLCRRLGPSRWETLCSALLTGSSHRAEGVGFTCAAGTAASNIYAGGDDGDLWHFNGKRWVELRFPRGTTIETLCCFTRWAKAGIWKEVFAELIRDRDNKYLMLDTTLVRVHQQAATGKGGPKLKRWNVPEVG